MKKRGFYILLALATALFAAGCGGGGGGSDSGTSSGTLKVNITDAKPALPAGVEKVWVTINEVSVHQAGGSWVSLSLSQSPYTIDLLQFADGEKTELVPPAALASGRYTQIRLGIVSAAIQINGVEEPLSLEVPSGTLKTDKTFQFDVAEGGAVDLTVDFDLSRSIVAKGSGGYQLKPVLHLVHTQEAATLAGSIAGLGEATVIVYSQESGGALEEYTRVTVEKGSSDPTAFSIYWLAPNHDYIVRVEIGVAQVYEETMEAAQLPAGAVFQLNSGNPI